MHHLGASGTDLRRHWCNGDRYVCTALVQINLSPLHQIGYKGVQKIE